ncbi:Gryzun, putative trafficking through golgi-domain-containing protein [Phlyctochytrium arcticum]|nr:Gryzun, putative trafficking through golgi-domain-containing protein [Phlyctochytrium arcticum]
MEWYPLEYVLHHVPLMAVMGLVESEQEQKLGDDLGSAAVKKSLLAALMAKNNLSIWDASAKKDAPLYHFTVLDKAHVFPPRKLARATPPQHSNLSPLSPGSSLHPDGIMSPAWIQRHKVTRPAIVVGFYDLWEGAEPVDARDPLGVQQALSVERERDLLLCSEVNEKKRNASERGIRFAVVVILKRATSAENPHIEERLNFIRRTCGLDLKSSLFVISATLSDINPFLNTLQAALFEPVTLYYRDHEKRVRKKKARLAAPSARSAPPIASPTASSVSTQPAKPLPSAGWHLRYEYKLGVFAEFRQDMDTAIKHYESAYQLLVELFQSAVSGSTLVSNDFLAPFTPRWTEARTLLDCINLKICKLYLYTDRPVPALLQIERHIIGGKVFPECAGPSLNEETRAVSLGLARFGNLPGGGSFEFWNWASIQYRVFGELVELATAKIGLKLPFPPPGTAHVTGAHASQPQVQPSYTKSVPEHSTPVFGPNSATNVSVIVQHAGYYYFAAARCAEERWRRFQDFEKNVISAPPPPPSAASSLRTGRLSSFADISSALGSFLPSSAQHAQSLGNSVAAERNADHPTLVIELLTKAYEQFKKHRAARMTLFLAAEIARVYEQSGKYEMALKFFERIGKTYRKEHWDFVLKDVLHWSVRCAKALGRWDVVVECLVELLSERMGDTDPEIAALTVKELFEILAGEGPHMTKGLRVTVDMDQLDGFLNCQVQLKKHSTYVGTPAVYQVVLCTSSEKSPPVPIRLSRVHISFSDSRFDQVIVDDASESVSDSKLVLIEFNPNGDSNSSYQANLQILPGMTKVLESAVVPNEGMDLKLSTVTAVLASGDGEISLVYKLLDRPENTTSRRRWAQRDVGQKSTRWTMLDGFGEQATLRVIRRQPNLSIKLRHSPPGYLDEVYGVDVDVVNEENEEIEAFLDIEFRLSGQDALDPCSSVLESEYQQVNADSNSISGSYLGKIAAHGTASKRLWLKCNKDPGERVMYNIVYYRSTSFSATSQSVKPSTHPDLFFRKNEPIRLMFVNPFEAKFETALEYGAPFQASEAGLLSTSNHDEALVRLSKYRICAAIQCVGPWDVEVADVAFLQATPDPNDTKTQAFKLQVVPISSDQKVTNLGVWKPNHVCVSAYQALVESDAASELTDFPLGHIVVRWRRNNVSQTFFTTTLSIPSVQTTASDVSISIDVPPILYYTTPFTVTYKLHNTSLNIYHLSLAMEVPDGFVFSGFKHTQVRLLPLSTMSISYICVPLLCGRTCLPKLRISIIDDSADKSAAQIELKNALVRGGLEGGMLAGTEFVGYVRPRGGDLLSFV